MQENAKKTSKKIPSEPPSYIVPFSHHQRHMGTWLFSVPTSSKNITQLRGFKTSKKFTKWLWNLAFHFSSYPASLPVDWEYRKESFSPTSFCYKTVPNMRAEVKLLTMKRERLRGYETTCAHPRYSAPKFSVNSTNLARVRRPRRLQARIPYISTTGSLIGVKIAAK